MRFDHILVELVLHHTQFKLVIDELLESLNCQNLLTTLMKVIYSVTFPVKFKLCECNTDAVPEYNTFIFLTDYKINKTEN